MIKDKSIIFLIVFAALILGYFIIFYSKIEFELKSEYLYVNIHDTVNLKSQVSTAKDSSSGKRIINKIKYSGDIIEDDKLNGEYLYIGDFDNKTITYTLKYKFRTIKKVVTVIVITDPNDPAFKPNYDYEGGKNDDDIPNSNVDSNLTEAQKEYIESLLR